MDDSKRLHPHEMWFFPDECFFTQEQKGEKSEKSNGYRPRPSHGYRCSICGAKNKTRRCLVCHPLPEDPNAEF